MTPQRTEAGTSGNYERRHNYSTDCGQHQYSAHHRGMADNSQLPQAASQITPSSTGPSSPGNGGASIRRTSPPSLSRTDAASGSPLQHSSSPSAGSEQAHGIPIDDDDDPGDSDSAVEAGSAFSDSTSLKSEIMRYRFENGRRYHSYKDGEYWGPNDEKQNNQLDIAHHLYLLTLGGKLFLVPIGDNPQMSAQVRGSGRRTSQTSTHPHG